MAKCFSNSICSYRKLINLTITIIYMNSCNCAIIRSVFVLLLDFFYFLANVIWAFVVILEVVIFIQFWLLLLTFNYCLHVLIILLCLWILYLAAYSSCSEFFIIFACTCWRYKNSFIICLLKNALEVVPHCTEVLIWTNIRFLIKKVFQLDKWSRHLLCDKLLIKYIVIIITAITYY